MALVTGASSRHRRGAARLRMAERGWDVWAGLRAPESVARQAAHRAAAHRRDRRGVDRRGGRARGRRAARRAGQQRRRRGGRADGVPRPRRAAPPARGQPGRPGRGHPGLPPGASAGRRAGGVHRLDRRPHPPALHRRPTAPPRPGGGGGRRAAPRAAPWGLHVSLIEPGTIATPIWEQGRARGARPRCAPCPRRAAPSTGRRSSASARMAIAMGAQAARRRRSAKVVEHALTASRPKTRYLVGDARSRRPCSGCSPTASGTRSSPAARVSAPPPFAPEHEALRAEIRALGGASCAPTRAEWEADHWFPDEVFRWCAERGLPGPEVRGGVRRHGGGYVPTRCSPRSSRAAGRAGWPPASARTRASRRRRSGSSVPRSRSGATWRPRSAGERIGALGITEPDAGSDVAGIRTAARREDGGWVVNGSKMFITNGVRADFIVTAVKTRAEGGHHGLSFLIVDRGEGVAASPIEKLGWHASDTALDRARGRVGSRGEPARRGGPRLLPDHGQLPVGAPAHGARLGGRDAGDARAHDGGGAASGREPGGPPRARRLRDADGDRPRAHLPRAAPLPGRRRRGARGDDGQAGDPARGLRGRRHLPRPSPAPTRISSGRPATPASVPSAAGPTRS